MMKKMKSKAYLLFAIALTLVIIMAVTSLLPPYGVPHLKVTVVLKGSFHIHTTYSDGDFTPTTVVQMYHEAGYDVLGISDHSTVDGVAEAKAVGEPLGMIIISAQEVTLQFPDKTMKHIVALFTPQTIILQSSWYNSFVVEPIFEQIHNQDGIGYVAHPWVVASETKLFVDSPWYSFRTATYIDGWAANALSNSETSMLIDSGYFCIFDHDFHRGTVSTTTYNLLFCHNRTEAGVKEAFLSRRIVCVSSSRTIGTPEALQYYNQYKAGG